jgi:hypothetical protein
MTIRAKNGRKESMEEMWRSVKGFDGKYEVSNLGNVRSVDREVPARNGHTRKFKGRTLKPCTTTTTPYLYVNLTDKKKHSIHRLVAEAFLEKKEEEKEVDHIDGNPKNNKVDNLEWVTRGENLERSYTVCGRQNNFTRNRKRVLCVETNTIYDSIKEASKRTGFDKGAIRNCVKGLTKTSYGYHWTEYGDTCEEHEER